MFRFVHCGSSNSVGSALSSQNLHCTQFIMMMLMYIYHCTAVDIGKYQTRRHEFVALCGNNGEDEMCESSTELQGRYYS